MITIEWLDEYNTGNVIIDHQHHYLFDLANQMVDPDNDHQAIHHKFVVLDHFLKDHFAEEEKWMAEHSFSEITQHKHEHELLLSELDEIRENIVRGGMNKDKLLDFMRHWLFDHFLKMDMTLKEF